jgi:small subunit ribosomal protein S16
LIDPFFSSDRPILLTVEWQNASVARLRPSSKADRTASAADLRKTVDFAILDGLGAVRVGSPSYRRCRHRRLAAAQIPKRFKEFAERNRNPVLMIRLARFGARKQPYYRVVVIEKDRARNGRSLEVVGTYNPRTNPASVLLKKDRIEHWTSHGAQLSDRVAKLLKDYKEAPAATPAG